MHHKDLELAGLHQFLSQQGLVLLHCRRVARMRGSIDDPPAVGREERASIVADLLRQAADVSPIQVHRIEIQIAVPHRGEDDRLAVRRDRRLGIIPWRGGESLELLAVQPDRKNVVVVQRPSVPAFSLGLRGAIRSTEVRRGIQYPPITGEKVAARGGAGAGADQPDIGTIQVHHVHLVAAQPGAAGRLRCPRTPRGPIICGLEDQFGPIERKIGLRVLATRGQLADIGQMALHWRGRRLRLRLRFSLR